MMWSHKTSLARLGGVLTLSIVAASAQAQGVGYGYGGYDGRAYGYGFAEPAIRGDYVGAPFTRLPRPSNLVPSVWGYGTYGVPTMTGIRSATVGVPTVYVIDSPTGPARRPNARATGRDKQWSQAEVRAEPMRDTAGGARVIPVSVPRR